MQGAFETGIYRNLWSEYGYSEKEVKNRLEDAFQTIFYGTEEERFYREAGDDMGYLEDTGNHDVRTEGMSYGMMVCVQLDKKEEFFAMALFFASNRWGDGEGIFNYSQEARNILSECVHKGEEDHPGEPMWDRERKLIKFIPGVDFTDPSYHLPHFYELFALWAKEEDRAFWKQAAQASREYLHLACHPDTGLSPEYSEYDGKPHTAHVEQFGRHDWYYSDAYRTMAKRDCTDLPGILLCKTEGTLGWGFPCGWNKTGRKSATSGSCNCSKCSGFSCGRGGIFQRMYGKILEYATAYRGQKIL